MTRSDLRLLEAAEKAISRALDHLAFAGADDLYNRLDEVRGKVELKITEEKERRAKR